MASPTPSGASSHGNVVETGSDDQFFDESPPEFQHYYGPGRFHPVHFGDLFDRSRYKILRKLGSGSYSTVWLAKDRKMKAYVALKIPTADFGMSKNEIKIHEHLSSQQLQHPGKKHVTTLLASFEHHGPNGVHQCLVLDVMGPNANSILVGIPKPLRPPHPEVENYWEQRPRYPLWMAKSMLRQILLGLDYLHKCGVVHGDLQPGNILVSLQDLSSVPEKDLAERESFRKEFEKTVNRRGEVKFTNLEGYNSQRQINGKPDPCFPRYIIEKEPMFDFVDFHGPLQFKISDLGGAVLKSHGEPVTPLGLRSPEMIIGEVIGPAQDIWSFGCLVFEFLTGKQLFSVLPPMDDWSDDEPSETGVQDSKSSRDLKHQQDHIKFKHEQRWASTNDEHILDIAVSLGPVPSSFMRRFTRSNLYFNKKGGFLEDFPGKPASLDVSELPSIEVALNKEKGTDLSNEEAKIVAKLLRTILRIEVTDRPTAKALLADPWFAVPTSPKKKRQTASTVHQDTTLHPYKSRAVCRSGPAGRASRP